MLVDRREAVAGGIAEGILRFLDALPRADLFAEEIVVPVVPAPSASPTATATP